MLIRQTGPVIGADGSTYTQPGDWNLNVSARALRSTDHYNTDVEQVQRQTLGTYVVNLQRALDFTVSRQMTPRFSLSVGVPWISASWAIPRPTAPVPGPRANEPASGLGDISVASRMWVMNPKTHPRGNLEVGIGLKMPTGKSDATATFVGSNGQQPAERYVDMSVQPGDGGWGITTEIAAFKQVKKAMIFASANYLINPRDTSGTPSNGQLAGATPTPLSTSVNSTPDQYLVRAGSGFYLGKGFSASGAYRIEGLPRYDLVGHSHGFRRPGFEMFIEPGVSYTKGGSSFGFTMPWAFYRNRLPNPYTGSFGDATFPRFIVLATYSQKLGGSKGNNRLSPTPGTVSSANNGAASANSNTTSAATLSRPTTQRGQELVELAITGMTCEECVNTVQTALRGAQGVVSADVSIAQQRAIVVYEPKKTNIAELEKVVKNAKGMNAYTAKADSATVTLAVTGMTCEQCADTVRAALAGVSGVTDAKVDVTTNTAVVTYQPSKTKVKNLLDAVKNAKGMNAYSAKVQVE